MENNFKKREMKKTIWILLVLTVFLSCSKDDPVTLTLQNGQLELFHKDKGFVGASTTGDAIITYTSSDVNVAKVSDDGTVTAGIIGNAEILVSDGTNTKKCIVEVKPKYTNIKEAFYKDGASRSDVKAYHTSTPTSDTESSLIYEFNKGSSSQFYVHVYMMENNLLTSSGIIMSILSSVAKDVPDFIGERYLPVTYSGDIFVFKEKDNKYNVVIVFDRKEGTVGVMYSKYEDYTKSSTMSIGNEVSKLSKFYQ